MQSNTPTILYQAPYELLGVPAPAKLARKPFVPRRDMVRAVFMLLVAIALAALAVGCTATTTTTTPQVTVFVVKASYEGALTGMVAYARLPRCTPQNTPICSQQTVLDQLERARLTARTAIDAADGAVRTPGFGTDTLTTAVAAADAATKALTTITSTLPKPK